MEAATPLRAPVVRALANAIAIEALVVEDETTVRLVSERAEAGTDPAKTVVDAIEIGARVLDRELQGANADFVRAEFEKAAREVETQFGDRARQVAEFYDARMNEVFGAEDGQLAKELARHFSDDSSGAVQNRVREVMAEAAQRLREDLMRQFSSADGRNPLADFKAATVRTIREAGDRQEQSQRVVIERMAELQRELQAIKAEREKAEEVAEERERGTAKGRTFEESVFAALDELAVAQGDCAEAVGDERGTDGRKGDVIVDVGAAEGAARARIVFEAKDSRMTRPKAIAELDAARRDRDAAFAMLVVPTADEVPAKLHELREYNGDKLVVAYDPDADGALALGLAYRLARARVLMTTATDGLDGAAVRAATERAAQALGDARNVKAQLTSAVNAIERGRTMLDNMESEVGRRLVDIDELVTEAGGEPDEDDQLRL